VNVGELKAKAKTKDKKDYVSFKEIVWEWTLSMPVDAIHASGGSPPLAQDADFLLIVINPAIPITITSEISPHCPKVGIADTKQDPEVIKVPKEEGEPPTPIVLITLF